MAMSELEAALIALFIFGVALAWIALLEDIVARKRRANGTLKATGARKSPR
jgi:hypothetical protein